MSRFLFLNGLQRRVPLAARVQRTLGRKWAGAPSSISAALTGVDQQTRPSRRDRWRQENATAVVYHASQHHVHHHSHADFARWLRDGRGVWADPGHVQSHRLQGGGHHPQPTCTASAWAKWISAWARRWVCSIPWWRRFWLWAPTRSAAAPWARAFGKEGFPWRWFQNKKPVHPFCRRAKISFLDFVCALPPCFPF